jgi:hypothetical protein
LEAGSDGEFEHRMQRKGANASKEKQHKQIIINSMIGEIWRLINNEYQMQHVIRLLWLM